jgi:HEAT repeat protein
MTRPVAEWIAELASALPAERRSAAAALGASEQAAAVEPLIHALDDAERDVRFEVACALGSLADKRAVGPLVVVLRTDTDPGVRAEAAQALGLIGDSKATEALDQAHRHDRHPRVRGIAGWAIQQMKTRRDRPR